MPFPVRYLPTRLHLLLFVGVYLSTALSPTFAQDMVLVPAGEFLMGTENHNLDERPAHTVRLDSFYIDRHEVTVAQYRACLESGACFPQPRIGGKCNWWKPGRERHPMNCIDWFEAERYCQWADKRLPTEAEWEKAARGTDGRSFPWGEELPNCKYAVAMDDNGPGCGSYRTGAVGSKPKDAGPYGTLDMGGNLSEWVADWYADDYYARSPASAPPGPDSGTQRIIRGGSWKLFSGFLRTTHRYSSPPIVRHDDVGIRCARDAR